MCLLGGDVGEDRRFGLAFASACCKAEYRAGVLFSGSMLGKALRLRAGEAVVVLIACKDKWGPPKGRSRLVAV